jgi:preprotein translocase SecE subunit
MTHHSTTARRSRIRLFNYIGEIINELKKVVWLKPREWAYLTVLVLIVAVVAGIVLGALDYGFTDLVDKVFVGK